MLVGHAPMKTIAATFAKVLLFSLTVFFLGPQLGSLDTDGDGLPDVPVMVMHASMDKNVRTAQSDRLARVHATESPFSGMIWDEPGANGRIPVYVRMTAPHSPLRC